MGGKSFLELTHSILSRTLEHLKGLAPSVHQEQKTSRKKMKWHLGLILLILGNIENVQKSHVVLITFFL